MGTKIIEWLGKLASRWGWGVIILGAIILFFQCIILQFWLAWSFNAVFLPLQTLDSIAWERAVVTLLLLGGVDLVWVLINERFWENQKKAMGTARGMLSFREEAFRIGADGGCIIDMSVTNHSLGKAFRVRAGRPVIHLHGRGGSTQRREGYIEMDAWREIPAGEFEKFHASATIGPLLETPKGAISPGFLIVDIAWDFEVEDGGKLSTLMGIKKAQVHRIALIGADSNVPLCYLPKEEDTSEGQDPCPPTPPTSTTS